MAQWSIFRLFENVTLFFLIQPLPSTDSASAIFFLEQYIWKKNIKHTHKR